MNTDFVPSIKDSKIRKVTRNLVNSLRDEGKIESDEFYKDFQKSLVRRAKRQVLREIKEGKYARFANNDFENLIPKL